MFLETLESLGLSQNEAKVYQALIVYGGSGVSTISLRAKVHRRNVYDAIDRLIDKGLVYEVFSRGENVYEAVDPGKLKEFVEEKDRLLQSVMPQLQQAYTHHRVPQRAYIYEGVEGIKNYLREILKSKETIYSFAGKGAWYDERLAPFVRWFHVERKKQRQQHYIIWDDDACFSPPTPLGSRRYYKCLPPQYSTNSTLDIFGDHVVTFTGLGTGKFEDDVTIFVMVSERLADSYRTWWKYLWDTLPEPGTSKKAASLPSNVAKKVTSQKLRQAKQLSRRR